MQFTMEAEQETDGCWIAGIIELPEVMKYGKSREDALRQAEALVLRVMAERIERGERAATPLRLAFKTARVNGPVVRPGGF